MSVCVTKPFISLLLNLPACRSLELFGSCMIELVAVFKKQFAPHVKHTAQAIPRHSSCDELHNHFRSFVTLHRVTFGQRTSVPQVYDIWPPRIMIAPDVMNHPLHISGFPDFALCCTLLSYLQVIFIFPFVIFL